MDLYNAIQFRIELIRSGGVMAFIPTVNSIRVSVEGTIEGQLWVLTLTVGKGAAITQTDVQNAADRVQEWWDAELAPILTTAVIATLVKAVDMATQTALPIVSVNSPNDGAVSQPTLPNSTALVTTFRTGNAGRSGRGRNYLMGLPNNQGNSVRASAGTAAAVDAAYTDLNSYLTPSSLFHTVVSKFTNGGPRASGLVQPVLVYDTNTIYDVQRRRAEGRGA